MPERPRLYLLDTNVLMHDPTSLFRFAEHDIYLPMMVLEELDRAKKGVSEVARNVRQVSRFIGEMMAEGQAIEDGLPIREPEGLDLKVGSGRLYFQTERLDDGSSLVGDRSLADNEILLAALNLTRRHSDRDVILVSKDINLRIKAAIHGIPAEDYHNDRALDDLSLLYTGMLELDNGFWDQHGTRDSWTEEGRTYYRMGRRPDDDWHPNQCLRLTGENGLEALVREVSGDELVLEVAHDYRRPPNGVWGIMARNPEQNFALNLLMDPDIDFVTLLGTAGTGKTLLALAAGLAQTLDNKIYREIVMTRVTVSVGEDIGFLPGTEEEKMTPWMGALTDNLEVLTESDDQDGEWGRAATNDLLASRIKIRSLNFMRGRTFLNRYLIIDEAQNLTPKQMKTLITRAGPGTKIVCLGNVEQIDTPYLTETTSGLTFAVDRFKYWPHAGHITLRRGERSRLADFASESL
ncbi:PhoH family protein [Wenzhouxiangella marina]|uniref:PhoH family protein n=1 Tax=Wenzhouxiangella marina TaxID=1579979 RepID=A0A0K0XUJ6_9GAMM|nr:PhoH family protein [Wenzhouxiangella marina]AKS41291.1 PhoH family protein [Wenzhouxiangella marina]MBB6086959.1 PhoH-like ATPase [Wenzhouxiangella marina]